MQPFRLPSWLRTFSSAPPDRAESRSVGQGIIDAMYVGQAATYVLLQPALVITALSAETRFSPLILAAASTVVVLAGVVTFLMRIVPYPVFATFYATLGLYFIAASDANSVFVSVLLTLTSWTVVLPALLSTGYRAALGSGLLAAAFALCIGVAHPAWGTSILLFSVTMNVLTGFGGYAFMSQARRVGRLVDEQQELSAREALSAARAAALNEASAEYTRVLHDTVVNTFGALSQSRIGEHDPQAVRTRCLRDLERIRAFRRDHGGSGRLTTLRDLDALGVQLEWVGVHGDDLHRYESLVPDLVMNALLGCASEAILNAQKHARAERIRCSVSFESQTLSLTITDDGIGFDAETVVLRGIASSIHDRAEQFGIGAEVDSRPGSGTRVHLSYLLTQRDPTRPSRPRVDSPAYFADFKHRTGMVWCGAAILFGAATTVLSPRDPIVPRLLILGAFTLLVLLVLRVAPRRPSGFPVWLTALLLLAIPFGTWNALVTVGFGEGTSYLFPALTLTVPHVLLHLSPRPLRLYLVSLVVQITSFVASLVYVFASGTAVPWSVLMLDAPLLFLLGLWWGFFKLVEVMARQLDRSQHEALRSSAEAAAHEAGASVRMQWSLSGLQTPFRLLESLADGTVSIEDAGVRERCAEEESFLRQMSAVPPEATLMTWWFALALAESRDRALQLSIQVEGARVRDPHVAQAFGELLLACVSIAPLRGELSISLVQHRDQPHLFIVGTADSLRPLQTDQSDLLGQCSARALRHRTPPKLIIEFREAAEQVFIEARPQANEPRASG